MVVIKPPAYQTGPVGRNNEGLSKTRVALYLFLAICLIYASEHYHYNKSLRGQAASTTSASVKVAEVAPGAATETKAATVATPKPFVAQGKICERDIGVNLADHTKWPTPYTPSYFDKEPESDQIVFVNSNGPYGATLVVALFHAIDLAYDKKCGVMVEKTANWIWDKMSLWFYGSKPKDDAFYKSMEEAFGIKVVDSLAETRGKELHALNAQGGLYAKSTTLDAVKVRNRRDTIYRNLFALSPSPCDNINKYAVNKADAMYTVIDVPTADPWNKRFDDNFGKIFTHAYEMKPEYVKSILKSVNLLGSPVYLGKTLGGADPNRAEVTSLVNDQDIKTTDKDVVDDLYMAVLANCFIGYPSSHWSLMVARMRYALDMKNTFVLTAKVGDEWRDYVDEDNHLMIHDKEMMGVWFG